MAGLKSQHNDATVIHPVTTADQPDTNQIMVDYSIADTQVDDSRLKVTILRCAQILHLAATGRNMAGASVQEQATYLELVSIATPCTMHHASTGFAQHPVLMFGSVARDVLLAWRSRR